MHASRSSFAAAALALAAGSFGCASGKATFRSTADLSGAAPITRVFAYVNMKSKGFTDELYVGFEKGLTSGFAACGVKSAIMHVDPLALDPKARFKDALVQFNPDAALFIKRDGGNITIGQGGTNSDLIFELSLVESKTDKRRWFARSEFSVLTRNMWADDKASGEDFASSIVNQLQADGVLKGCPAGGVISPHRAAAKQESAQPQSTAQ